MEPFKRVPAYASGSRMPSQSGTPSWCARTACVSEAVVVHPQIGHKNSGTPGAGVPRIPRAKT
jgi:hypothetical protein